jgi:hypothetical protein
MHYLSTCCADAGLVRRDGHSRYFLGPRAGQVLAPVVEAFAPCAVHLVCTKQTAHAVSSIIVMLQHNPDLIPFSFEEARRLLEFPSLQHGTRFLYNIFWIGPLR